MERYRRGDDDESSMKLSFIDAKRYEECRIPVTSKGDVFLCSAHIYSNLLASCARIGITIVLSCVGFCYENSAACIFMIFKLESIYCILFLC
jgi:hypothetical protein